MALSRRAWHPWRMSSVPKNATTASTKVVPHNTCMHPLAWVYTFFLCNPPISLHHTQHTGDETDLPTNIEVAEETQGVAEEDGIKFTGFNLREERATGYFDEEGNYVERKGSDDEDDKDAWLDADGGWWDGGVIVGVWGGIAWRRVERGVCLCACVMHVFAHVASIHV